ncbi:protein DEFECTIVE IN MERISTEM SILENCING 3 [Typha latifolia]|uniref:protein DEFECTIVE IN MERISTEM SILENCING 3 n=1 Tax=Typha latifolia TaxID=4733 RepID=UPI003C307137
MMDGEYKMENSSKVEMVETYSQKLEDDLKKLGLKIKHHEDNLKFLNSQMNNVDESILDMQVNLGKYHSSHLASGSSGTSLLETEQRTIQNILKQEKTAAGIICQLKVRHGLQASKLALTKDVLGVVATLGKVIDDNLSRLFSEYLGLETMLAIVCKTYEGVKVLEKYDKEGMIDKNAGLHGLGPSIGRPLDGRFLVFCLENLRPFVGDFIPDDPQRKLALINPRLPNGESPPGFMGFAVNMFYLDHMHLSCLTGSGHGLRETLFYSLFSRLQVYKTRADMQHAIPYISDGAVSLDGGIMKSNALFYLGSRRHVDVKFPIGCGASSLPANIVEVEEQIKLLNWRRERLAEDIKREEAVLSDVKNSFSVQKQELKNYLTRSAFSR